MFMSDTRVVAVDWSGSKAPASRKIWLAEVDPASMSVVRLEPVASREGVTRDLIAIASRVERLVVGLDFAFSMPAWFLDEHGLADAPALWEMAAREGEHWLADCAAPFWGRVGKRRAEADPAKPALRRTEQTFVPVAGIRPKSVFQVGGAGSVGTGSIRGMPHLATLRRAGFAIWPFDDPGAKVVVEIYPRVFTRGVSKSDRNERRRHLATHHPGIARRVRSDAIDSDDAFDALVSALAMAADIGALTSLTATTDPQLQKEGAIWGSHAVGVSARVPLRR
jgi:hypothetical protein